MSADFAVMSCNGRMTSDPKTFEAGKSKKTVFSIAVNRYFKKNDELMKKTTFIDCVAWGAHGERVAKFGKKGAKVTLSGNWETDIYNSKENGEQKKNYLNINHVSIFTAPDESGADAAVSEEEGITF
jgi:single stranded DNA-binding protein